MNRIVALLLLTFTSLMAAQTGLPDSQISPAERGIAAAKKMIAAKPTQYSGYNQLAIALARRARETSDVTLYTAADSALKKSFELSPGNAEGEKIRVWLLLGRHDFPGRLRSCQTPQRESSG